MKAALMKALARLRRFGPDKWLVAVASLLALLLLVQGIQYAGVERFGKELTKSQAKSSQAPAKREGTKSLKEYDAITAKGILGGAPQPHKLFGIMGNSAYFGTSSTSLKPYAVGATVPGAGKIIEIGCDAVVLEKEGKQRTLTVFPELKMAPPSGKKR